MKKHGVIMVFLLILALCLMGSVSASEDLDVDCDDAQISLKEDVQTEVIENEEVDSDLDTNSSSDDVYIKNEINYENYNVDLNSDDIYITEINYENYDLKTDSNDIYLKNEINYESYNLEINSDKLLYSDIGELSDLDNDLKTVKINDKTTENVFNKIMNSPNGYVTYNNGNLLMLPLSETNLNIENDESLLIRFNIDKTEELQFSGNDGLTDNFCDDFQTSGVVSGITSLSSNSNIANKGPLSTGIISNQENYPQNDLPLGKDLLSVSRDSDDNAFVWYNENPDKKASVIVDMVKTTNEEVLELNLDEDLKLTADEIKEIGVNASLNALDYFKSQGIDIQKGYPYLYVLTTSGVVKINETSTDTAIDGISEVLGLELNKNIFPIHNPLWKDLIFYYLWVNSANNKDICSYALKYDVESSKLIASNEIKKQGDQIAYDMGLYEKYCPTPKPHYNRGCVVINKVLSKIDDNSSNNDTNVTNTTEAWDNNSAPKFSISYSGNPLNVIYTIIAIAIVSIIFGAGYSKRNK